MPIPTPALGPDTSLCNEEGKPLVLDAGAGDSYEWFPGHETGRVIEVSKPGVYSVKVSNKGGCSAEDSIRIEDNCSYSFYVPNTFTPQPDQINDVFRVIGEHVSSFSILIYNRWGECVYSSTDMNQGWDGRCHGQPCPEGVYLYKLSVSGKERGRTVKQYKSGTILLMR